MRLLLHALALLSLTAVTSSQTTDCRPGDNCVAPDCRCWNDREIPGGIPQKETPQVISVTFEYAVNDANVKLYTSLFEGSKNPNGCPAVGTFFVQRDNSNLGVIKSLADSGHEIGVTSVDGTLPGSAKEWSDDIANMKSLLVAMGVPEASIRGVRAPELRTGGLNEFIALSNEKLQYDASCVTSQFDSEDTLLWPFTYDFAPGPSCENGESPEKIFPGKWQVMLPDLQFNGTKCATPAACTAVASERDAFDLFYDSFIKHYEGSRSPFIIVINPQWVLEDFKLQGTIQFLSYVTSAFDDTWLLSVSQALDWIKQPVPNTNATTSYPPWDCS